MVFGTFDFLVFLGAVVAINWTVKPHHFLWRFFLLVSSVYFYSLIDWRFAALLGIMALATYSAGLAIGKRWYAKAWLAAGIAANIGVLFAFKYYDFFRVAADSLFAAIGLRSSLPYWEIVFPIGVSFYAFRMVSYLVDLWRKKYPAERNLLDFSVYAFFFPYLLAGPITRAEEFLPQLKNRGARSIANLETATTLLFLGLFKKLVLSSWIGANVVDDVFAVPESFGAVSVWLAVIGYTLSIYCDFSGYSDLAIASAMFLGFELSPNFLFPYLSTSIAGFWRRWHISFYSWMRDYVYIPLGGNRSGAARSYANTLIVFALSGLWHGAAIHYVVWGLWHGIGLCTQRFWNSIKKNRNKGLISARLSKKITLSVTSAFKWLATFVFVSLGWIFFRAETMERSAAVFSGLLAFNSPGSDILTDAIVVFAILAFVLLEWKIILFLERLQAVMPFLVWLIFWLAAGFAIYLLAPDTVPPFIYFSF